MPLWRGRAPRVLRATAEREIRSPSKGKELRKRFPGLPGVDELLCDIGSDCRERLPEVAERLFVECGFEAIRVVSAQFQRLEMRRLHDLGREGERGSDRPGSDAAIVRTVRRAPSSSRRTASFSFDYVSRRPGTVARRNSPRVSVVGAEIRGIVVIARDSNNLLILALVVRPAAAGMSRFRFLISRLYSKTLRAGFGRTATLRRLKPPRPCSGIARSSNPGAAHP